MGRSVNILRILSRLRDRRKKQHPIAKERRRSPYVYKSTVVKSEADVAGALGVPLKQVHERAEEVKEDTREHN